MPVAIRKRPINVRFKSSTPKRVLKDLKFRYARYLLQQDPLVDYFSTDFHKSVEEKMTPGDWLCHLREAHGLTQAALAQKVGGTSPARISDWENGRRAVSKDFAKKFSAIFGVPADQFI